MKKLIALIFLVSFAIVQYGKLVSYWNCKITKSSDPQVVQCDCEKILETPPGHEDLNLQAKGPLSFKTDEWTHTEWYVPLFDQNAEALPQIFSEARGSSLTGHKFSVFQPPRFS